MTLICRQKIKFILHVFLKILQRYCKNVLGTLGMPGYGNPKWYYHLVENVRAHLQAKNSTSPPPMLFWRYCKDMQTSYFGYFGHAWLQTPSMIVSTWRRFRSLSAYPKYTSSFTSFLRYYILKNSAIWFAGSIFHFGS